MSRDFDFLAEETLKLCEKFTPFSDFDSMRRMSYESFEKSIIAPETKVTTELEEGPGLLFWVSQSQGTYSIRGIYTYNIKGDYNKFLSKDKAILGQLKLSDEQNIDLNVFPTYTIHEAKYIYLNLLNRRILHQEDWATNISDPGNHWWLTSYDDSIEIQFGNRGMYSQKNVIELGPIGDGRAFSKILNKHISFISEWIPYDEFSTSYKSLKLIPKNNNDQSYQMFKNIFLNGEVFEGVEGPQTINQILYQLSWARKFWIFAEKLLK